MKKVILGNTKKPTKKSSKNVVTLPTGPTLGTVNIEEIEPLMIFDEREYLRTLQNEENYNILKQQLKNFGDMFPNEPDLPANKKGIYKEPVRLLLKDYTDASILKYIIRLFLNQYSLTFVDFYNKFLKDKKKFLELRELRKLLLKILKTSNEVSPNINTPDLFDTPSDKLVKLDIEIVKISLEKMNGTRYEKTINKILDDFSIKLLLKFIKQFLNQTHQDLLEFYNEFIKDDVVQREIRKYKGVTNKFDIPIVQKPISIVNTPLLNIEIRKYKPFLIDSKRQMDLKSCVTMYTTLPWIPDMVKKTYISEVDTDISSYILKTAAPINVDARDWYPVNKKYYQLLCDNKLKRVQNGDVLNFMDLITNEVIINFMIGYEMTSVSISKKKTKLLVQNEALFLKEQEYISQNTKTDQQKINEILTEPIKPDVEKLAFNLLKDQLYIMRLDKYNTYFKKTEKIDIANDKYIKDLVSLIASSSKNVLEFAEKIGQIFIYITNKIDNINYRVFKTLIENKFYKPETVINLTEKEKLPEIFGDQLLSNEPDIETIRTNVRNYLNNILVDFIEDFIDSLYTIYRNPYTNYKNRRETRGRRDDINITLPDWRLKPKNLAELSEKDKNTLGLYITYEEEGSLYYLNILEMKDKFNNTDDPNRFKNHHTGKDLSPEIIKQIQDFINITKGIEIPKSPFNTPITNIKTGSLALGLLDFIREDISRMKSKSTIENIVEIDSGEKFVEEYDDEKFVEDDAGDDEKFVEDDDEKFVEENDEKFVEENENSTEDIIRNLKNISPFDDSKTVDGETQEDGDMPETDEDGDMPETDEDSDITEPYTDEDSDTTEPEIEEDVIITEPDTEEDGNITEHENENEQGEDGINKPEEDFDDNQEIDILCVNKNCEYCLKPIEIGDKCFKSTKWNNSNGNFDIIVFCCLKCIENFPWKKYKYKRPKKIKN